MCSFITQQYVTVVPQELNVPVDTVSRLQYCFQELALHSARSLTQTTYNLLGGL